MIMIMIIIFQLMKTSSFIIIRYVIIFHLRVDAVDVEGLPVHLHSVVAILLDNTPDGDFFVEVK